MTISFGVFAMLIYIYLGYPLAIYTLGIFRKYKVKQNYFEPKVTVIIAAFNEEKYIKEKLINALELDYPSDKLEVILVSDGSTDSTLSLARTITNSNLIIIEQNRSGKATALNAAITKAGGELILFTDANVFFERSVLKQMIPVLADPQVGAVTGKVNLVELQSTEPLGEGVYMRYERFIQKYESLFAGVIGTDGGMFLAKRDLIHTIPADIILDDFYIVMRIILSGKRVIYEESAKAIEYVPASVAQEFKRKTRIAAGGFQVLSRLPKLMVFTKNPGILFEFYSHKLLRWLTPIFLIALYLSTFPIDTYKATFYLFVGQNLVYLLAIIGHLSKKLRNIAAIYICYYFVAINVAVFIGMIRAFTQTQSVIWNSVKR